MIQAMAVEAVAPIFKAMVEALEDRLLRMHNIGYDSAPPAGPGIVHATAGAAGHGSTPEGEEEAGGEDSAPAPLPPPAAPPTAVVDTSSYIQECVAMVASFRCGVWTEGFHCQLLFLKELELLHTFLTHPHLSGLSFSPSSSRSHRRPWPPVWRP